MGGECRTILKMNDAEEVYGRLRILSKISYLFDQCKSWEKARAAYFAMLSSIEEGDASWSSSFGHYDLMCPAPQNDNRNDSFRQENKQQNKPRSNPKRDFFCKDFQKGECTMQNTH